MISIIIPTYNRAHLINKAIESVLNQTATDWELIIVDDGSTDNTFDVISHYLDDERVKYLPKENSGAPHSRNIGVENCTSEYITFLDSDDELKHNWLEKINVHIKEGKDIVFCGCDIYDEELEKVTIEKLPLPMGQMFNNISGRFTGGTYVICKKLFKEIGGFDISLKSGQHTELTFRLIPKLVSNDITTFAINESLMRINIHKGERIRNNNTLKYIGALQILKKHKILLKNNNYVRKKYLKIAAYQSYRHKHFVNLIYFYLKYLIAKYTKQ